MNFSSGGTIRFLAMLMDAAKQDNPTQYYSTAQIIENIASEFKNLCKL